MCSIKSRFLQTTIYIKVQKYRHNSSHRRSYYEAIENHTEQLLTDIKTFYIRSHCIRV